MNVNFNLQSMVAQRALKTNENRLSASTERLSSGYKINHAKDDAAGMAISKKMRMQIRGLDQAGDNADNGISVCETADGALAEIEDMVQRMNELAIKASNGTHTTADRTAINLEVTNLLEEITRISTQTDFNGATLLDGTFDLRGYTDTLGVKVADYSDALPVGVYTLDLSNMAAPKLTATADVAEGGANFCSAANKQPEISPEGDKITFTDNKGKSLTIELDDTKLTGDLNAIEVDITGIGAFTVQVGSNEGQILDMRIPEVSLSSLGIDDIDMLTQEGARSAIDKMSAAVDTVSLIRSRIGAYQNRLEHTASSLDVTSENMTAAVSRIIDLDMSEEMVDYTTYQVLVQAGTSMLTQANEQPERALQLLQ